MLHKTRPVLAITAAALFTLIVGCASKPKPVADKPTAFWPPYPDEPRLQYLTSFTGSASLEAPKSKFDDLIYGKEVEKELGIKLPYGVAIWNGRIYVCDLRSASITILDLKTRQTLIMGTSGASSLTRPTDIAIAPDGYKYVADLGNNLVVVFDPQDRMVNQIGHKDLKPTGVAVFQDELYVCDFATQQVIVFDRRTGQQRRAIGEKGSGPGQFVRPLGVDVDAQGNVYVCDVLTCQVQQFDPTGKFVKTFGTISANAGGLVRPKHIAVDREGIIFVVDAAFQNVQLFNADGQLYTFFGSAGGHPGSMYLPAGICVDDDPQNLALFQQFVHPAFQAERLVLVTNQFGNNKVAAYALGRLKEGKTVADISMSKGLVPEGTGAPPVAGPGGPIPTTGPAGEPADGPADVPAGHPAPAAAPAATPTVTLDASPTATAGSTGGK